MCTEHARHNLQPDASPSKAGLELCSAFPVPSGKRSGSFLEQWLEWPGSGVKGRGIRQEWFSPEVGMLQGTGYPHAKDAAVLAELGEDLHWVLLSFLPSSPARAPQSVNQCLALPHSSRSFPHPALPAPATTSSHGIFEMGGGSTGETHCSQCPTSLGWRGKENSFIIPLIEVTSQTPPSPPPECSQSFPKKPERSFSLGNIPFTFQPPPHLPP